jgi:hypothetical protein
LLPEEGSQAGENLEEESQSPQLSQEGKEPRFSPNLIRNCLRIQTA